MSPGHCFAFLGAAVAGIGAPLAVIHVVFAAFFSTSVAYFGAQAAELLGELRVTRHELSRQNADVSAIPVEPDAPFHHLHVILLQAGSRAVFTFLGALQASLNATSILFVSHIISPFLEKVGPYHRISTNYFQPDATFMGKTEKLPGRYQAAQLVPQKLPRTIEAVLNSLGRAVQDGCDFGLGHILVLDQDQRSA